ncbi:C1QL [Mytilus edulis]|uniref:C1QL n=1 Tax=Mytilus edulis TaxID=6550 RepID=A0A8S3TU77_MYTED|nr:C1QL [Mytilus edulis]
MHSVQHLNNVTKHLQQEIQNTNNHINVLESDATARKQDFIALVQDASQMKMELARYTASMLSKIDNFRNFTAAFMDGLRVNMSNEMNENNMNYFNTKQVALTACGGGTYNDGDTAKFSNIKENHGINSLDSFKQSGKFTCEVAGMYVFFASMMSSSNDGYFQWYTNSRSQSGVYISHKPPSYESGSGMLAVKLNVGDTVSLKCARSGIVIHEFSCFTFSKFINFKENVFTLKKKTASCVNIHVLSIRSL